MWLSIVQLNAVFLQSIIIGLITGLYSGLVIARYSRFAALRADALSLIKRIEFMSNDDGTVTVDHTEGIGELSVIASTMCFVGHKTAGSQLLELVDATSRSLIGTCSYSDFYVEYGEWQRICRQLQPDYRAVLLHGKL